MSISLFRALTALEVADGDPPGVVGRLEAHAESIVNNNIKSVEGRMAAMEGKLTGLQASLDPLRAQLQSVGVMIGIVGLAIAAGPIVARFVR
jgi:hypothetical protein